MTTGKSRSIAFLGTGLMGAPMARRFLHSGFPVTVWNRNREKAQGLVQDGAVVADTPAAAVKKASLVFTMLADGKAVEEVLFRQGLRRHSMPARWSLIPVPFPRTPRATTRRSSRRVASAISTRQSQAA